MKKFLLFVFTSIFILSACKKEEIVINQVVVPDYNDDGVYVIKPEPNLIGNVEMISWPSYSTDEAKVYIDNRLSQPIGYLIRDKEDTSFVYFYDSYIKSEGSSEKYGTKLPFDTPLYAKMLVYKSTWSYLEIQAIEVLGLNFWSSIEEYKDKLKVEYEFELVLQE